jgi:hypothetical protein
MTRLQQQWNEGRESGGAVAELRTIIRTEAGDQHHTTVYGAVLRFFVALMGGDVEAARAMAKPWAVAR